MNGSYALAGLVLFVAIFGLRTIPEWIDRRRVQKLGDKILKEISPALEGNPRGLKPTRAWPAVIHVLEPGRVAIPAVIYIAPREIRVWWNYHPTAEWCIIISSHGITKEGMEDLVARLRECSNSPPPPIWLD